MQSNRNRKSERWSGKDHYHYQSWSRTGQGRKEVVLVDADPQGHLTMGLGFPKNLRVTLKTMMENIIMGLEFDPKEAVLHHAEGIDVIPSNKLLSGMDMSLFTVEDREKVLKEYLELLEQEYDYILIDCMPHWEC